MDGDLEFRRPMTVDQEFLKDVSKGLSQNVKNLSPKWLYDHAGSELFEKVTRLPEYYLTRLETDVLRRYADILAGHVPPSGVLVELGSGASVKTRMLLDEGRHFRAYAPVDISEDFLIETAIALRDMYPKLSVLPIVGDFLSGITFPDAIHHRPKVGFFPGSTIGNMPEVEARALLRRVRTWPGAERFIIGFDLVKDVSDMVAAYDDAQGVTAAFIRNILVRINRELGADFDPDAFVYHAEWNARSSSVDMSLVSACDQTVHLTGKPIRFDRYEAIHVSTSRKFHLDRIDAFIAGTGWQLGTTFTDPEENFAVCVLDKEK